MPRQRPDADPAFVFAQLTRIEQQHVLHVFDLAMQWGPSEGAVYERTTAGPDGADRTLDSFEVDPIVHHNLTCAVAEAHDELRPESIAMLVRR